MAEVKKVELTVPTSVELMGPADAAYRDAVEVVIDCDEMRDVAVEERNAIKKRWNDLEDQRKTITKPLLAAKEAVDALFKPALARLESARMTLDNAVLSYNAEQIKKQREEQARLEAAAAAERKRMEAEAAKAAAEAEALAAQAAQATDAAEAERLQHEADARAEAAAAAATTSAMIVAPVAQAAPKMVGASTRTTIEFELVDIGSLIKWIASQLDTAPHLANLLVADSVKMRAYVKTYGPDTDKQQVPGVRIYEKGSLAASRRAA